MPSERAAIVDRRHEVADVSGRRIAWIGAALATMLVLVALAAWLALSLLGSSPSPTASSLQAAAPRTATPRLQSAPSRDLQTLRAQKDAMLNGYRWLDRGAGVVQIPIERAMELMEARSAKPARTEKATEATR